MPLVEGTMVVGCVANGFLLTVSDWCAQMVERGVRKRENEEHGKKPVEPYDLKRTIRFAGIGVFLTGPLTYTRYAVLGGLFGYGATGSVALQKAMFNQLLFDPPETAIHLASIEYLRSRNIEKMKSKVKADYLSVQIPSWGLAIPVNIATFTLFPFVWQQMIFQRTISTCFNVYFSFVANREVEDKGSCQNHNPGGIPLQSAKSISIQNDTIEVCISSVTKKEVARAGHRRRFRRRYTTRQRDRSCRRSDDLKRPSLSTMSNLTLYLVSRTRLKGAPPKQLHNFVGSRLDEQKPSKWKSLTSWSSSFLPTSSGTGPSRA
eukprot:TRINITY_DN15068_c0_g1_i1.p1 TRINITY_DN15068_c0_g1~~TRINITY_DN15068_c0_g1_i1.p1  ORF type:complete len:319 (+),score=44.41 TRINITY_DN15068_c0_g1_i1:91-1047(+)